MKSVFTFFLLFSMMISAKAQYVDMTGWDMLPVLKYDAGECFDGNKLDTTCSGLLDVKSVGIGGSGVEYESFSTNGLQYLKKLEKVSAFSRQGSLYMPIEYFPKSLKEIDVEFAEDGYYSSLDLGVPQSLISLSVQGGDWMFDPPCDANIHFYPSSNLEYLYLAGGYITIYGELPDSLKVIYDAARCITDEHTLPPTLEDLSISAGNLNPPYVFPATLKRLELYNCGYENFINLQLYEGLEQLELRWAGGFGIQKYPSTLKSLIVEGNRNIPFNILPNNLETLEITASVNSDTLHNLPNSIKNLSLIDTKATILPDLPPQLELLDVSENRNLRCLPTLPTSLKTLNVSNTKIKCIPNETTTIKFSNSLPECPNSCDDMPTYLAGLVYLDINKDGRYDSYYDRSLQGAFVHVNDKIFTTDVGGRYRTYAETGVTSKISVTYQNPNLEKILPVERSIEGVVQGWADTMNFAVQLENSKDIEVRIAPFRARNGFTSYTKIFIVNRGAEVANGFNLSAVFPSSWTIDSIYPAANSVADSIFWNNINLDVNRSKTYRVWFTVPATDSIGTPFSVTAQTHGITDDIFPESNIATYTSTIRGSFDPNDKLVYPETIEPEYDDEAELLYTIRFQNTGNDTAFTVVIKDTIQPNLDPLSFRWISSSHNAEWSLNEEGIVTIIFNNILLLDSNTNESKSHGQVTFAIKPKAGLTAGMEIENRAAIYFDYNAPVITNSAISRVEVITSVHSKHTIHMKAYPNPTNDILYLQWAEGGASNLSISDISGKVIQRSVIQGHQTQLPVQHLSKGMYLIQIENEKGTGIVKFIVQ